MSEYKAARYEAARAHMLRILPEWCESCEKCGDCTDAKDESALDRCPIIVKEITHLVNKDKRVMNCTRPLSGVSK